jgi:hypothetical protein
MKTEPASRIAFERDREIAEWRADPVADASL